MRGGSGLGGMHGGIRLLPLFAAVILSIRALFPVAPDAGSGGHPDHLHAAPTQAGTESNGHDDHRPPDRHDGPCHFCRLSDTTLPPPSFALKAPDRPVTAPPAIPEDIGRVVPAFQILAQPRAPPRDGQVIPCPEWPHRPVRCEVA
ncbi:MAG TPA: DUF2946 family protein [Arenibaculum sp.]|nr:DUF2946 family protein [Arenibaculum sp.]